MKFIKRLGFSTNAFTSGKFSIFDAIKIIGKIGYRGVEILADKPLLWPYEINKEKIKKLKKTLKEFAFEFVSINGFTCVKFWDDPEFKEMRKNPWHKFGPCFCDFEEEFRKMRINYTKRLIDLARKIGCRDISTCSGYLPLRGTREIAWRNMVESLRVTVDYAERKKVNLNIEYEPGLLVGSAKDALRILKEIDSPNFGLNFDVGHSFSCGEKLVETIKLLSKWINSVHIEDIGTDKKGRPVHYHLIPGKGKIPFRKVFRTFEEVGYEGFFIVELYTYSHAPIKAAKESFKYFESI